MFSIITERLRQKHRTVPYPEGKAVLPERFRGLPHINAELCTTACATGCGACAPVCPTNAISVAEGKMQLDVGRCTFCGACANACPAKAISFTRQYQLGCTHRESLILTPSWEAPEEVAPLPLEPLQGDIAPFFKRSFRIREISGAGCNACEADCNVLGTIVFDLPRFGIDYVASPRHADAILVTGPVPRNMQIAMQKCYAVMPPPKLVIAVGVCAISGGLFSGLEAKGEGVPPHLPVDLYIPGCPPHPYTILDALLRFLGKI